MNNSNVILAAQLLAIEIAKLNITNAIEDGDDNSDTYGVSSETVDTYLNHFDLITLVTEQLKQVQPNLPK